MLLGVVLERALGAGLDQLLRVLGGALLGDPTI